MSYSARRCRDVSLNAVANLGYADCRFLKPVFPGDTLSAVSQVIGLKENSNRQSGVVYVRSQGFNQRGETVIDYVRWVMVRKRDVSSAAPETHVPKLPEAVAVASLGAACPRIDRAAFDPELSGSPYRFEDYRAGERIDHVDGVTVEEAEHQTATRLYQNAAKVHFNQFSEGQGRFGRRLIYGGHVISLARALSFNGLANAFHIAAINGGRHVAPLFAGDTVFAWSEILETAALPGRDDVGALRGCARSRPRTALAPTFPGARARATSPMSCSSLTIGRLRRDGPDAMRLPADAVLLIIDAQEAVDGPRHGAGDGPEVEKNIAALVAAWRAEGLPLAHVGRQPGQLSSPAARRRDRHRPQRDKRLRRRRPRSQARRTRRDDAGPMRRARDPCARSIGAARRRSRLSGVCRRRRVPGGRHGRSQRAALAG